MSAILFLKTVLTAGFGSLGDASVSLSCSLSSSSPSSEGIFSSESGPAFPRLDFPNTHTQSGV